MFVSSNKKKQSKGEMSVCVCASVRLSVFVCVWVCIYLVPQSIQNCGSNQFRADFAFNWSKIFGAISSKQVSFSNVICFVCVCVFSLGFVLFLVFLFLFLFPNICLCLCSMRWIRFRINSSEKTINEAEDVLIEIASYNILSNGWVLLRL